MSITKVWSILGRVENDVITALEAHKCKFLITNHWLKYATNCFDIFRALIKIFFLDIISYSIILQNILSFSSFVLVFPYFDNLLFQWIFLTFRFFIYVKREIVTFSLVAYFLLCLLDVFILDVI